MRRMVVPSFKSRERERERERDMNNLTNELSLGDLEAVSGGMRNQANDPGFHQTFATSFGTNNGSPLYGTGSFHDQIDNVDGLP
jgi:Tfp pilus assembly protein FimT